VKKYTLEKPEEWLIYVKEHQRDVRLKHITHSALSEHNIETGQILFDKTITIATHHMSQESTGRL